MRRRLEVSWQGLPREVRDIIKQKCKFAVDVDVDLSKFFDRVNHDHLMTQLRIKVQDKRLADVIRSLLIGAAAQFTDTSHPQGCALINSTLTCNEASESIKIAINNRKEKIKPR